MTSRLSERRPPAGRCCSTNSVVDGIGTAAWPSGAEGRAAAAGRLRVRVLDREAAAHVVVDEVDFGALQVSQADRVHEELDAVDLEHLIGLAVALALVDHQPVLEARTPSALHEHTKC